MEDSAGLRTDPPARSGSLAGHARSGAGLLRSLEKMAPKVLIHGAGGPEMAEIAGPGLRDWVEDAASAVAGWLGVR